MKTPASLIREHLLVILDAVRVAPRVEGESGSTYVSEIVIQSQLRRVAPLMSSEVRAHLLTLRDLGYVKCEADGALRLTEPTSWRILAAGTLALERKARGESVDGL